MKNKLLFSSNRFVNRSSLFKNSTFPSLREQQKKKEISLYSKEQLEEIIKREREKRYRMTIEEAEELMKYCQLHPEWWLQEIGGIELWEKQAEIIHEVFKHKRIAIKGAYGVGKTFLLACNCIAWPSLMPDSMVLTTSPTGRQVKQQIWREVNNIARRFKIPLGIECQTIAAKYDSSRVAYGIASKDGDIEALTGYHADNILVCLDQAAGFQPETFFGAEGFITNENSRLVAIANAAISDSYFAHIFLYPEEHPGWFRMTISALDTPNVKAGREIYPGILAHDYPEKMKKMYGEDDPRYKIFVLAEFVIDQSLSMFNQDKIRAVLSDKENVINLKEIVRRLPDNKELSVRIAADIADNKEDGDDTVIGVAIERKLVEIIRLHTDDQVEIANQITKLANKYDKRNLSLKLENIDVDAMGVGTGVYSILINRGLPARKFKSSWAAKNKREFFNARAEAYWELKENLDKFDFSALSSDEKQKLRREMESTSYVFSADGRVRIVSKKKIKKILGHSPDLLDMIAMLFYDRNAFTAFVLDIVNPNLGVTLSKYAPEELLSSEEKRVLDEFEEFLLKIRPEVRNIVEDAESADEFLSMLNEEELEIFKQYEKAFNSVVKCRAVDGGNDLTEDELSRIIGGSQSSFSERRDKFNSEFLVTKKKESNVSDLKEMQEELFNKFLKESGVINSSSSIYSSKTPFI